MYCDDIVTASNQMIIFFNFNNNESIFGPQIREVWNSYELDLVNYQNKCRLIRGWDDLFNKVKEHINSVSAMKLSPYYKVMGTACCDFSLKCANQVS